MEHNSVEKKKKRNDVHAHHFMPKDDISLRILQERSTYLATKKNNNESTLNQTPYIQFRLGQHQLYGIPYASVKEVIPKVFITKIPFQPTFISGVVNWRGKLLTILDLKTFFEIQNRSQTPRDESIIMMKINDISFGILTDEILGSNQFDPTQLDEPFESVKGVKAQYLLGLHQGKTAIINLDTILNELEVVITKLNN